MNLEHVFESWPEKYQCRGAYARDHNGDQRDLGDADAEKWCAMGWMGVLKVPEPIMTAFDRFLISRHSEGLIGLNDDRGWLPSHFAREWKVFLTTETFREAAGDSSSAESPLLPGL